MGERFIMDILVLENDPNELILIHQALDGKRHSLTPAETAEQAWEHIKSGRSRFLIANWDMDDLKNTQFIPSIRASSLGQSVYILLIASKQSGNAPAPGGMDDVIYRPFKPAELKNRIAIAERIISLTSSLATARDQLENHAVFDSLTGFMNRAAFLRQSAGELERSRRASLPLSLIALDVDNFKVINDTFGNETGDEILKVVSRTIREKSRPYDTIGRWTGDEFVIALPGVIGADAEKVAERVIAGVRGTRIEVPDEATVNVKISAGIASISRITTSIEVEPLIQHARQAVTRAKEAGGNQVFIAYL
ncbi:MAG: diguanylate cyclase [Anaerolineaceae bacterium]|jgi:diguanylate cyclase (GGDEF)-like protein|nr:MAG: diguanylate cyclase [Anaerolineaceae bacterium]